MPLKTIFVFIALGSLSVAAAEPDLTLLIPGSFQRLAVDANVQIGKTPFHILQSKFDKARSAAVEEMKGWYAGRCFYEDSPTRAVAAVLTVQSSGDAKANGPAFATSEYRKITPIVSYYAPPDYFDSMTSGKEKNLGAAIQRYSSTTAFPVRSNDMLIVEGLRTLEFEAREYLIRKSGNFLLLRMVCKEHSYCMNYRNESPVNRVVSYEGDSPVACYFFKRTRTVSK